MNKFTKQCVAAFASLSMAGTLCVAGAVVAGSSAWAAGTPSIVSSDSEPGKGKTGTTDSGTADYKTAPWKTGAPTSGSITIYKWKNEADKSGNQEKKTPIQGAGFTIKKVKSIGGTELNLNNYTSWSDIAKSAQKLNAGDITTGTEQNKLKVAFDNTFTLGEGKTNKNGVVQFKDLPLGLYQVQETTVPSGYSAAETKPFYMTLPMIESVTTLTNTETKYNYAPFIDPKNVDLNGTVTKEQDLTHTVGAGDTIEYTIKAKLDKSKATAQSPDVNADEFKGYTIFDLAPSDYFTAYDQSVITKMTVGDTENKGVVTEGTKLLWKEESGTKTGVDYTVDNSETIAAVTTGEDSKKDVARTKIKIEFTDAGRTKLATEVNKAANAGKAVYVTVHFKFKLKTSTDLGTKKVTNKASVIPSHADGVTTSEIPAANPPSTEFATFKIKKVSSQDDTALGGAKFRLFAVKTEAEACTKAINEGKTSASTGTDKTAYTAACETPSSAGFGEKTTATTADTAKDIAVGETEGYSVKRGTEFYVVETEAPSGYIRNPDVHAVTVEANKTTDTFTVKNIPGPGLDGNTRSWLFNLPKTGAAGVTIFAIAGMGLVGIGIFVFMRNRKKDEEQQNA